MIRPVPDAVGQAFGENPTNNLPRDSWIIETFGNYQPWGHAGQDYTCGLGTPIRAITSGIVRHAGYFKGTYADNPWWCAPGFFGYGWVIEHDPVPGFPDGFFAEYGHGTENSTRFRAGQRVNEGDVIGLSGNTGGSTGPHLHLGVLPSGYILNSKFYGRIDPELLFNNIGYSGSTIQEEDDMYEPGDRARDELTAERVNFLWEQYGPGQDGYRKSGPMADILLATKKAADTTLFEVTPGVAGKKPAGSLVQVVLAAGAKSNDLDAKQFATDVAAELADGVQLDVTIRKEAA